MKAVVRWLAEAWERNQQLTPDQQAQARRLIAALIHAPRASGARTPMASRSGLFRHTTPMWCIASSTTHAMKRSMCSMYWFSPMRMTRDNTMWRYPGADCVRLAQLGATWAYDRTSAAPVLIGPTSIGFLRLSSTASLSRRPTMPSWLCVVSTTAWMSNDTYRPSIRTTRLRCEGRQSILPP